MTNQDTTPACAFCNTNAHTYLTCPYRLNQDTTSIDEILTGLGAYKITTFEPTADEYYAYYPELKHAKHAIEALISDQIAKARIDELNGFENEELITYHSKIAETIKDRILTIKALNGVKNK